jgi:hypothetical protein
MTNEPNQLLGCKTKNVQKIIITLSRNLAMRDWSVEIDGQRHEHVTADVVEALVECQLIVAETSLAHQQYCDPGMPATQRAI